LLFQQAFHITDEVLGYDILPSQHPQAFQKYGQCNNGTKNNGIHENAALYNQIKHDTSKLKMLKVN
jgi:hypothetical protein